MSFTKRILRKEIVIDNLENVQNLLKVDCLILDKWSSNFYNELNPDDREIRKKIISEFKGGCPNSHPEWHRLNSISESLISISSNPNWVDIHFIQEKIGRLELSEGEGGSLEKITQKAKELAIKYFEK